MPHYSTVENMLIGSWSSGSGPAGSGETEILRSWCVKTGLDFDEVSKKRPAELSVGQRQRLSFIRAIMKDYTILFGDEPTGNLDDVHARLLLDELKESIRMNSRKSAIVVSHNIRLSVEKADFIIVLSPGNGTVYHVSVENVFKHTAAGWETNHGAAVPDIELELLIRETAEIRNTN
jgi:ABC-type glutathione transport system ATPase component